MIRIIPNSSGKTVQLLKMAELFYGKDYDKHIISHLIVNLGIITFKYEYQEAPYNIEEKSHNFDLQLFRIIFLNVSFNLFIQKL